ncbi:MAG TPA: ABC transporter substrate-binding protein [Candidatus Acidoferrum sp.]|jgi:oligopeptide transport system substrate-binding protein|nr:ABC transporter substrate-binding protein [Candidatus Acidoferrum sp.]
MSVRGLAAKREGWSSPPRALTVLFALACAIAVIEPAMAQDRAEGEGVYRRPLGGDPATLDPARIDDVYSRSVAQQIFDGLVTFDQTLAITPALAQYWKASRDGLTWTFTLRKGVKFHHGREVTADDVVFSFTRILDPRLKSSAADAFAPIRGAREFREGRAKAVAGLVALDANTVQVTLTDASTPFVSVLALGHAKIVPREIVEQRGEGFGLQPVGTGPFRFAQWERGKSIVLTANPDYFDGAPRLRRLVYRIFAGEQSVAMFEEFRKGHLEDSQVPTPGHDRIVTGGNYLYVKRPMFNLRHYAFNTRVKPLDDRRVRQAIVRAVDRTWILKEVFAGRFIPALGILPPGTLGFNPALRATDYDPQRARELLDAAGYPAGRGLPPITFWSSVRSERLVREHDAMRKSLAAVGVRADFQYQTDWPAYARILAEGKEAAFLYAWFADVPDPDNFLRLLFYSRSPRNLTGYNNPLVDDLLVESRNEGDVARRVDLLRRAEQIILDDAVILPIWHYPYERVFQPYVKSVEVNGLGDPYIPLRKIWLERAR